MGRLLPAPSSHCLCSSCSKGDPSEEGRYSKETEDMWISWLSESIANSDVLPTSMHCGQNNPQESFSSPYGFVLWKTPLRFQPQHPPFGAKQISFSPATRLLLPVLTGTAYRNSKLLGRPWSSAVVSVSAQHNHSSRDAGLSAELKSSGSRWRLRRQQRSLQPGTDPQHPNRAGGSKGPGAGVWGGGVWGQPQVWLMRLMRASTAFGTPGAHQSGGWTLAVVPPEGRGIC